MSNDCSPGGSGPIRNFHDVLSHTDRRTILYELQDRSGPVAIDTVTADGGSRGDRDGAVLRSHVVEMARFGLLEYDPGADTVRIADEASVTVTAPRDRSEKTA